MGFILNMWKQVMNTLSGTILLHYFTLIQTHLFPHSSSWSVGHEQMSSLANQKLSIWPWLAEGQHEEGAEG